MFHTANSVSRGTVSRNSVLRDKCHILLYALSVDIVSCWTCRSVRKYAHTIALRFARYWDDTCTLARDYNLNLRHVFRSAFQPLSTHIICSRDHLKGFQPVGSLNVMVKVARQLTKLERAYLCEAMISGSVYVLAPIIYVSSVSARVQ